MVPDEVRGLPKVISIRRDTRKEKFRKEYRNMPPIESGHSWWWCKEEMVEVGWSGCGLSRSLMSMVKDQRTSDLVKPGGECGGGVLH